MRHYIGNYTQTLSTRREQRVSSLLENARVGKERLSEIIQLLDEAERFQALITTKDSPNSRISPDVVSANLRRIRSEVTDLFEFSNSIALMLSSHAAILTSDIKAAEDELMAMEKMVQNFSFLLLDNQAFDYAFLEAFSDERGRDTTINSIPDRTSISFGPADNAAIRIDEGVLTLPENIIGGYGLVGRIVKGNATAFTISDTGLDNVFQTGTSTGWRKIMATAGPVTNSLPEAKGRPGAQVVLEFSLDQPAPCSEIKLTPYADLSVELLQIITYAKEGDSDGLELLDSPRRLDRPFTFHFPMQSVSRFHVILSQPTYQSIQRVENVQEHRYRQVIEGINFRRLQGKGRNHQINVSEHAIQNAVFGRRHRDVSLPSSNLTADRGPMSPAQLVQTVRYRRPDLWKSQSGRVSYMVQEVMNSSPDLDLVKIQRDSDELGKTTHMLEADSPAPQVMDRTVDPAVVESGFNYYYNIGLHHVSIGVGSPGYKGVFVSKPLPSPGDIGEIRLRTEEDNYVLPFSDRHSPVLTSVEYSVSNQSSPELEDDWIPILPVGANEVVGERMFVNTEGFCTLRFPAQAGQSISVFRNGYIMNAIDFIYGSAGNVDAVKVNTNSVSPDDVFTIDYFPSGDHTTVNFSPYGFEVPPLVFAHDAGGSGERFLSTGDRNTITLSSQPYINPTQARFIGFTPITVRFDDGTVAENLTDYRTGESAEFPPSGYYYIHSGDMLMFNQPIRKSFRVFYEYLQNNVRVRVVLRCNSKDFVSPKVDYVQLKAKTRLADSRNL